MSPRKKVVEPEVTAEPTQDEIAVRAYEIHESGEGGDELENWLQAERELESARYAGVA
jgi:Protein of unknown function (DUF2934)